MRNTKFRGFDNENKAWRYGHFFETVEGVRRCYNIVENRDTKYYCDPNSIGQFSGLQDENGRGKDVYEGDVFEAIYKDCPDGYSIIGQETKVIRINATVVFRSGKFMVELMHPQEKCLVYSDLNHFLKNEEKVVIGNIHTSPELLSQ